MRDNICVQADISLLDGNPAVEKRNNKHDTLEKKYSNYRRDVRHEQETN